jgi:molybdate transport system substrate-binding protein
VRSSETPKLKICFCKGLSLGAQLRASSAQALAKTSSERPKPSILETHPLSYLTVTMKTMQSAHEVMHHRRRWLVTAAMSLGGVGAARADARSAPIRVAAASDLKFALPALAARFERETGLRLTITFGSSGHLARQLSQGLPMDLFLSADEALVIRLANSGWARDEGVVYGRGQLAWLVPKSSSAMLSADLTGLVTSVGVAGKLAIANPEHAPYGRAAQSALQARGLWDQIRSRLVLGESVSQATQFVSTGAAQAGLVALSLALAPELLAATRHVVVQSKLHPPIIQRLALSQKAPQAAQRFYAFLQTETAKDVFRAHGLGA